MSTSASASLRKPSSAEPASRELPGQGDTPGREKPRSQSSPAARSPTCRSPQALPPLALSPSSAGSAGHGLLPSSSPDVRSPRSRVRFSEPAPGAGGGSAPSTPREKSPRTAEATSLSGRHRVAISQHDVIGQRSPRDVREGNIEPSVRRPDDDLIALGNEAARLIFLEIRSARPQLTKEGIDSLARFEVPVPLASLPAALRARIVDTGEAKISHARLIKALYLPLLTESEVGKTLLAMRKMVMLQYGGQQLTLAERVRIEEKDLGFKSRMEANMEGQAKACAAIALGRVGSAREPSLSTSKLPAELIAFWNTMDRQLCEWAAASPDVDAVQLRTARENLGFDILFTRLMLPIALGGPDESHLVIPMMFFDAVKRALQQDWPTFAGSMIAATAATASSASSASTTSIPSTASILSTASIPSIASLASTASVAPNVSTASGSSAAPTGEPDATGATST